MQTGMEISVAAVKEKLDSLHLIDVREPHEVAMCFIEGAETIPMMQLFTGLAKPTAAQDANIVVYCHSGIRSMEAAMYLQHAGYQNVRSMAGGIDAWACDIDPSMTRY